MTSTRRRPTVAELVVAVREQLAAPDPDQDRAAYLRRVAAGALAIVERELYAAERLRSVERRECRRLGVTDTDELAAAIRGGRYDDRTGELTRSLRAMVREQLAIDNPRYAAWDQTQETADGLRDPA